MDTSGKITLALIALMVLGAIAATGWLFYIKKDYDFVVEGVCDPETETCFYRDCSDGDCPPNELEVYKMHIVSAADFPRCSDNSCNAECASGAIMCEAIVCGESEEDECYVAEEEAPSKEGTEAASTEE